MTSQSSGAVVIINTWLHGAFLSNPQSEEQVLSKYEVNNLPNVLQHSDHGQIQTHYPLAVWQESYATTPLSAQH